MRTLQRNVLDDLLIHTENILVQLGGLDGVGTGFDILKTKCKVLAILDVSKI